MYMVPIHNKCHLEALHKNIYFSLITPTFQLILLIKQHRKLSSFFKVPYKVFEETQKTSIAFTPPGPASSNSRLCCVADYTLIPTKHVFTSLNLKKKWFYVY